MSSPQTMRDALVAELIGDLDTLITRTEELKSTIPNESDNAVQKITDSTTVLLGKIEQSSNKLRTDLIRDFDNIAKSLDKTAKETQEVANVVDKASKRFAFLALATGLFGGLIGGMIIGLAAAVNLFG